MSVIDLCSKDVISTETPTGSEKYLHRNLSSSWSLQEKILLKAVSIRKSKWSGFQEFHGTTVTIVVVVWKLKGLFVAVGHAELIHGSSRSRGRGMENQLFKNELKVVSSFGFIVSFFVVAMDSRQESGHTHYKLLSEDLADLRNLKNFAVSLINHFTSYCETIYLTSARFFLRYSATPCNFSAYLLNQATYRAGFFYILIFFNL